MIVLPILSLYYETAVTFSSPFQVKRILQGWEEKRSLLDDGAMKLAWEAFQGEERRLAVADAAAVAAALQGGAVALPTADNFYIGRGHRVHLPLPPYRMALQGELPPELAIAASLRVFELVKDPYGSMCGRGSAAAPPASSEGPSPPLPAPPLRLPVPPVTVRGIPCQALQELSDLAWTRLRGAGGAPRFADVLDGSDDEADLFGAPEGEEDSRPVGALSWQAAIPAMGIDREMDELEAELLLHCPPAVTAARTAALLSAQSEEEGAALMHTSWGGGNSSLGALPPGFGGDAGRRPAGSSRTPIEGLVENGSGGGDGNLAASGWSDHGAAPLPAEDELLFAPAAPRHDQT